MALTTSVRASIKPRARESAPRNRIDAGSLSSPSDPSSSVITKVTDESSGGLKRRRTKQYWNDIIHQRHYFDNVQKKHYLVKQHDWFQFTVSTANCRTSMFLNKNNEKKSTSLIFHSIPFTVDKRV